MNRENLNEYEDFLIKQIRGALFDLLTAQEKILQKHIDINTKTQEMQKYVGKLKEKVFAIEKQVEILSDK